MPREPHSPNNASMNINWFKETRAIPKNGMEYFAYRNTNIYKRNDLTKETIVNPNEMLLHHSIEEIQELVNKAIRDKIL